MGHYTAAKSITLQTEGGASMTIEGGNITFACPGTISIKAGSHAFEGPTSQSVVLPRFPQTICKECLKKVSLPLFPASPN